MFSICWELQVSVLKDHFWPFRGRPLLATKGYVRINNWYDTSIDIILITFPETLYYKSIRFGVIFCFFQANQSKPGYTQVLYVRGWSKWTLLRNDLPMLEYKVIILTNHSHSTVVCGMALIGWLQRMRKMTSNRIHVLYVSGPSYNEKVFFFTSHGHSL